MQDKAREENASERLQVPPDHNEKEKFKKLKKGKEIYPVSINQEG